METTTAKYAHDLRVSTAVKQGIDGYGIDAQRVAIARYIPAAEFIEVESGKRKDRPELLRALDYCKRNKAILVVAKLDRLARNVAFVSMLMESGVEFVCADFPTANRLTIHVLAAVAEHEASMISARTKAGLAAALPYEPSPCLPRKFCRRRPFNSRGRSQDPAQSAPYLHRQAPAFVSQRLPKRHQCDIR